MMTQWESKDTGSGTEFRR